MLRVSRKQLDPGVLLMARVAADGIIELVANDQQINEEMANAFEQTLSEICARTRAAGSALQVHPLLPEQRKAS
ncbi:MULTISPECIES: hypothetical protein [unclassified Streptomyces]|uniref:hypothetical protein n=1 Tax=unclassified Streptomyces TaxID=2593676 RepID=UPI00131A1EA5|nr:MULTISPECIES: hypothetical protein [unclassified Streptomyces]MYT30492.1 hypothetical protein [Streptomyces sp. SID8354]